MPEVLHTVERGVELLGQEHRNAGRQPGEEEAHDQETDAVRRVRPRRRDGAFQNTESLSLVFRFHALAELGLLVPLEQRLILLSGRLMIARQERKLILAVWHALQA